MTITFEKAMSDAEIPVPGSALTYDRFTRWGKNNRYSGKLLGDGVYIHDFAEGRHFQWFPDMPALTSEQEKERARSVRLAREAAQTERLRDYEDAAARAAAEWEVLSEKGESDYLGKKRVAGYGIRFGKDFIAVPMRDADGKMWSLQRIYDAAHCPDYLKERGGNKEFFKGGKTIGHFHIIGALAGVSDAFICEGYATGATVHQATDKPVIVAFTAGNLAPVIEVVKSRYPQLCLTIAADDDRYKEHNTGREKAEAAAARYGCEAVFPVFRDAAAKPTDFNDLALLEGIETVKSQLTPAPAKMLKAITLADFLKLELPPREMLLSPILARQGLAMLYAKPGMGKTYVSLSVALAVANGSNALSGRWVAEKPRRVLFVDGEMSAHMMQKRLTALSASLGLAFPSPDYLRLITPDMQENGIPDLATNEGQQAVEEQLEGVELLILDNLSSLMRQGKENEAESWTPLQIWLLSLRRRGLSVLVVHHANKGGGQRGTSKKEDLLDTVINLERPKDYDSQQGARFIIQFDKARGFYGDDAKPFEARLVDGNAGLRWEVNDVEDVVLEQVLLLRQRGLKQREIADEIGMSASTVNRLLKKSAVDGDNGSRR